MILPFVRSIIDGQTPLHLIESPVQGTGKTLLAKTCLVPALGLLPSATPMSREEEEVRKTITSMLSEASESVWFDNVHKLDSASLAGVLTTGHWKDRLLGSSRTLDLEVTATFVATGNNVVLSPEMARRSVRIRLDTGTARPWEDRRFKHEQPRWVLEHRAEVVHALLTLGQGWVAAGRPAPSIDPLGGYEQWSRVVGGIVEFAGFPGFLENAADLYASSDLESQDWEAFVSAWWSK